MKMEMPPEGAAGRPSTRAQENAAHVEAQNYARSLESLEKFEAQARHHGDADKAEQYRELRHQLTDRRITRQQAIQSALEIFSGTGKEKESGGTSKTRGFTLIELLVVIAIIALLASIILVVSNSATQKARDVKRKAEIGQIGQLFNLASCFVPNAGPGDYDILALVPDVIAKYPQYAEYQSRIPKDPRLGSDTQSGYRYIVNGSGKCAIYANLENSGEKVTLTNITAPTAGGGSGVLQAASPGPNGSDKYYEVSN